jgi:hypothetical protein
MLAKPNVIMNDIRVRGLAVAGNDTAGRKSTHNHAQTARNLKRSLRNAAAGAARLIQPEGLDNQSAADIADAHANALIELRRLERRLHRRIRRDHMGLDTVYTGPADPAALSQTESLIEATAQKLQRTWSRPRPAPSTHAECRS